MVDVLTSCNLALKEWAVTIKAMALGKQILIVRKGGIHQDDKEFRIIHPNFLLFPTYEHQKLDLLKSSLQNDPITPLERGLDDDEIHLNYWSRVTDIYELRDSETLSAISPFHHWTEDYVISRFRWRPSQPLTLALLRLFKLEEETSVPLTPEFSGCKSWVELDQDIPVVGAQPVLSDEEYNKKATPIREALSEAENLVI